MTCVRSRYTGTGGLKSTTGVSSLRRPGWAGGAADSGHRAGHRDCTTSHHGRSRGIQERPGAVWLGLYLVRVRQGTGADMVIPALVSCRFTVRVRGFFSNPARGSPPGKASGLPVCRAARHGNVTAIALANRMASIVWEVPRTNPTERSKRWPDCSCRANPPSFRKDIYPPGLRREIDSDGGKSNPAGATTGKSHRLNQFRLYM